MKAISLFLPALLCIAIGASPAQAAESPAQATVIATIDGQAITDADLNVRSQVLQIEKRLYDMRLQALDAVIAQKLLEKAAAAKNLSLDEYIRRETEIGIAEPTPQEVEGYYWGQKDQFPQPLETSRPRVAAALKAAKSKEQLRGLVHQLLARAEVKVLIAPPRQPVEIANSPRRGSASAPVMIVEFSDYQCPYCRRAQSTLNQVLAKYGASVNHVFKDLPLTRIHSEANNAAQAAHCAGEQGKYWEYHDALFAETRYDAGTYSEIATKLGLDAGRLQQCLKDGMYRAQVRANLQQAEELGIDSTPTFFINGIMLSGAQPFEEFAKVIDQELQKAKTAGGAGR
ncbi:MAG: thioredoxin domain-containing protein [Bryobacteraceae bacterium]